MKNCLTCLQWPSSPFYLHSDHAKASHMAGVDITYEWTGNPNEYLVRFKLYRDCVGISVPTRNYLLLFFIY
ncbi:MAG: hypothetical protein IPM91_07290 [Bacteroidetes bacterium]|nr:hypothetical protein [Bacteroidota bacterium]